MSESNAVQYEVVNKASREATPIVGFSFDDEGAENPTVRVDTSIGAIIFPHSPVEIDLENDEFFVREVGTHMATDGVHNTDETEAVVADTTVDSEVVAKEEGATV